MRATFIRCSLVISLDLSFNFVVSSPYFFFLIFFFFLECSCSKRGKLTHSPHPLLRIVNLEQQDFILRLSVEVMPLHAFIVQRIGSFAEVVLPNVVDGYQVLGLNRAAVTDCEGVVGYWVKDGAPGAFCDGGVSDGSLGTLRWKE